MSEQYPQSKDLVGRIFENEWTHGKYKGVVYQVEFLSENELRWTGMKGFPKGESDTQKYRIAKVDKDIYQFSWLADDDLSVIITYNFNSMSTFGVVSSRKRQYVLRGILKIIE